MKFVSIHFEPCAYCGEPCKLPPPNVPFGLDTVYCTPKCRTEHQKKRGT